MIDCDCDLMRRATCSSCGASILWARTLASASMPLDAEHSEAGKWRIEGITCLHVERGGHVAHWAKCLHAATHRKPAQKPGTPDEPPATSEAPGGPSVDIEWDPLRDEPLQVRIGRLILRDRSVPREERLPLAKIVAGLRVGVVEGGLVELEGPPESVERLREDRAWKALRDAAACCVAGTWEQHQALGLVLAEPTRKEEVA